MRTFHAASAVTLLFALPCGAFASDPAAHDVAVPTRPGESVVVEWTGTALPGADGISSLTSLTSLAVPIADPIGCPPAGPDDAHTINLAVPEGAYGDLNVAATFRIEWEPGTSLEGFASDADLKLAVYQDSTTLAGTSDGGEPNEQVTVNNPAAGTYTAIVCPFTNSQPVPYTATLTLTALATSACFIDSKVNANSTQASRPASGAALERPGAPDFDVFLGETSQSPKAIPTDAAGRYGRPIYDRALGVPTFLWARTDASVAAVGALNERDLLVERARAHLRDEAKMLHLTEDAIAQARVFDAQFNGNGPAVIRFRQMVGGIEVFHRSLNVLLKRDYQPVAVSGYFANGAKPLGTFAVGAPQAIAASWATLGGQLDPAALQLVETRGTWQWYSRPALAGSHVLERGPRARQVYYPRASGLEPAWHVEVFAKAKANGQLAAYGFVVSALNGAVLHRDNLKAEAATTYRVFADPNDPLRQPFDSPLGNGYTPFPGLIVRRGVSTNLVTLDHAGIVTGDPWIAADATETAGNHVRACIDSIDHPVDSLLIGVPGNDCIDGIEPATAPTAPQTFDYAIEPDEDPSHANAKNAAAVNLFYMINWLHDTWYNHGFDEASGNAQAANYGRGGEEGDPIQAQGQDGSGRNNANMGTPADGSSPQMQQYLFDGPPVGEVRVVSPVDSGPLVWAPSTYGLGTYDIPATDVVLADDGDENPTDGCGTPIPFPTDVFETVGEEAGGTVPVPTTYQPVPAPPQASLAGKIVLVDRGNCNSAAKEKFAMMSGAAGMVVVNNDDSSPVTLGGDIPIYATALGPKYPQDNAYQPPAVMISKSAGDAIKAQLLAGPVQMTLKRTPTVDSDGTMDNQIIAHEYFHYVHHRLTDSSNTQSDAMSEGWGDIDAFMVSIREDDRRGPGMQAAYAAAGYVTNDFYAGIRRAPYTTDFAKNAFTFAAITDDPEVHSAGEIWAEMMFECYAGLQNSPFNSFDEARSKMQDYIIGGFKMHPADATYTEARDAVLAVVLANDFEDFRRCSAGFARRGAGLKAVAPARSSTDLGGVVEDYTPFVCEGKGGSELPRGHGLLLGGALNPGFLLPFLGFAALRRRRTK
jgi:hypothetical protein